MVQAAQELREATHAESSADQRRGALGARELAGGAHGCMAVHVRGDYQQITAGNQGLERRGATAAHVSRVSKFDERVPQGYPKQSDVPAIIMLKRKAIRVYPDNQKVALYYAEAIDKYVSIPFGPEGKSLGIQVNEEGTLSEDIRDYLPGYRSSRERFNQDVETARKEGVTGSLKKFATRDAPNALMGATPVGKGVAAARSFSKRAMDAYRRGAARRLANKRDYTKAMRRDKGKKPGWLERLGLVGGGAALGGGGGGGDDAMGHARDEARRLSTGREYHFQNDTARRVSEPVSSVGRANANYRERQNQNQIWNTSTAPRSIQEFHSIIDSNSSANVNGITVTPRVAKKVIRVYENLNTKNKKNFEGMLNEASSLQKIINFCIKA